MHAINSLGDQDGFSFVLFETGSSYVVQVGLELLNSSDLPTSVPQVPGTTSMEHCTWLFRIDFEKEKLNVESCLHVPEAGRATLAFYLSQFTSPLD